MRLDRVVSSGAGVKLPVARQFIKSGRIWVDPPAAFIRSPTWICLCTDTITLVDHSDAQEPDVEGKVDDSGFDTNPILRGRVLQQPLHRLVWLHKPAGYISERRPGVPSVYDLIGPHIAHQTLGSFGRLDVDTTGLLIFGTDGGLCHLCTHPATKLPKIYLAECWDNLGKGRGADTLMIPGLIAADGTYVHAVAVAAFANGLYLADGTLCAPAGLEWDLSGKRPTAKVTLREGKYHQVKRMLAAVGAHVVALHREAVGSAKLTELGLAEGCARLATPAEVASFCGMFPPTVEVRDNPARPGVRGSRSQTQAPEEDR